MKPSDRRNAPTAGAPARPLRRDPRRSPGLFFVHVVLIMVLLAVACATVAVRSLGDDGATGRQRTVALPGAQRVVEVLSA